MLFTLETHVTYDREVALGDPLRITSQILDWDAKRLHFFHHMYHADQGYVAATNEQIMLHVGYQSRRSAPFTDEVAARVAAMAQAHAGLKRPAQAGRVIGIPRKQPGSRA
jgi:acyl-CoA thioester hydrolase